MDKTDSSNVRSIAFNLFNFLGTMTTDNYQSEIKNFTAENKSSLSKLGIRIGAKFFFIPNFLKKNAIELNATLWKVYNNSNEENLYPLPKDGRVSFTSNIHMPESYWLAIGCICLEDFAVRVDVFERISFLARKKIKSGPFLESPELMNPIGCNSQQLSNILLFCGFDSISLSNDKKIFFLKQKTQKKYTKKTKNITKLVKNRKVTKKNNKELLKKKQIKADPNSPFAVLQKLL